MTATGCSRRASRAASEKPIDVREFPRRRPRLRGASRRIASFAAPGSEQGDAGIPTPAGVQGCYLPPHLRIFRHMNLARLDVGAPFGGGGRQHGSCWLFAAASRSPRIPYCLLRLRTTARQRSDVPRVGVMHVGTGTTRPRPSARLRGSSDEKYGWDLPEADVGPLRRRQSAREELRHPRPEGSRSCGAISSPSTADTQADGVRPARRRRDRRLRGRSRSKLPREGDRRAWPRPTPDRLSAPRPTRCARDLIDSLVAAGPEPHRCVRCARRRRQAARAVRAPRSRSCAPMLTLVDPHGLETRAALLSEYQTAAKGLQRPSGARHPSRRRARR